MAHAIWRGSWATRVRIISGLILMIYLVLHILNLAAILISPTAYDAVQSARLTVIRSNAGTAVIGLAMAAHVILSLGKVVVARTFRMPFSQWAQVLLGLAIPILLIDHLIYTRGAHEMLGVNTMFGYVTRLIWDTGDGWGQAALLIIAWVHGCIGLHMWLRLTAWWRKAVPWLIGLGVVLPVLALLGFVTFARAIDGLLSNPRGEAVAHAAWNFPDAAGFAQLAAASDAANVAVLAILGVAIAAFLLRRAVAAIARPIRIHYVDGPSVRAPRGQTILETSQSSGVPHTALCGGRGRCTTCRVIIEEGLEDLPPPSEAEARSLAAVGAPPNARLACQVRPRSSVRVFRVFDRDGRRSRAHASQGKEAQLAVLFLDMRGFTARTDGQLPYDVVHLLNRFFDEIVPPINAAGGTVDKYMGDGLMAVFELPNAAASARAALTAVEGIGAALASFNARLAREGSAPVAIGIGVHLGNVVLGEIGAAGQAPRTLIGDTVNIASRLESETKARGVQALVSIDTLHAAGLATQGSAMVSLSLRGREAPLDALLVQELSDLTHVRQRDAKAPAPA
ncbi:2Fe-2S iron-sulfur cluster binding domain-containing protein [Tateyamaria omphalii]|uniref:adenylate/guanylate cyclase domain-containing protein n=1 Tax=Tateyamaria omphalii TaxID=299262 RepID=UPI001C98E7E3|nr:adenylate/guanylate cyclase domain-containing protein [Tateyamaria omphalii]MBY5931687.1 2Fe-2S iron-sulfur cluster binding domain-containing protein [Tateyamaria omphalii]